MTDHAHRAVSLTPPTACRLLPRAATAQSDPADSARTAMEALQAAAQSLETARGLKPAPTVLTRSATLLLSP